MKPVRNPRSALRLATDQMSAGMPIGLLDSAVEAILDTALRQGFSSRGLMHGCVPLMATRVGAPPL